MRVVERHRAGGVDAQDEVALEVDALDRLRVGAEERADDEQDRQRAQHAHREAKATADPARLPPVEEVHGQRDGGHDDQHDEPERRQRVPAQAARRRGEEVHATALRRLPKRQASASSRKSTKNTQP
ncbi:MAG: hypothetical protein ACYSUM_22715, partial [Planctomycetota bacterium]